MKKIRLLVTSDTHAQWHQHPEDLNYSLKDTANLLKKLQKECSLPTLQFDLGDFIQGSAMATYTSQIEHSAEVYARAMNDLHYNYQIIGNHEFNFGLPYQASALDKLQANILCANILDTKTRQPFIGKAYDLIELAGIKVGIVGLTTHYIPNWELPQHYQGLEFIDAFESAKFYVKLLRPKVDLLIVAYHGGFERDLSTGEPLEVLTGENQAYQMITQLPEIDILLTGHQHRLICQPFKNSFVLQPGYGGEVVGEVVVDFETRLNVSYKGRLCSFREEAEEIELSSVEPEYSKSKKWLNEILGYAPIQMMSEDSHQARIIGHPFVEHINYLMLKYTNCDFAGISLLNDHFVEFQGPISREKLLTIYPFYNQIAIVELTGEEIYAVMEHNMAYFIEDEHRAIQVNPNYLFPKTKHYNYDLYSGFLCKVKLSENIGNRVVEIIDEQTQKPLILNQNYRLAVTQYRAVGGGDYQAFTPDKILTITDMDVASLIEKGLDELSNLEWHHINSKYMHLKWL
ncbi:bifunctional metallophosphatase/5'-nucleotidase [Facklamia sp. DSM 111018]|uniref:Bifunctional metallophosphatase/5'-nucleotidase n=1 Tax=Facklamia lactis TaxID=2749967 RepID=A0ABS0LS98_9LACT|nr:bifunctional UDP-sugar hydrolase/5'-nucleotidase [Facklamia lactis]MBG9980800.1 bifunctional metallophosphatase/5'-nucleotidase [Facklamia lactis]MBG9986837.1 bifunctional metallophosphatase/5'-nucleotidase [Facklamia lactis]